MKPRRRKLVADAIPQAEQAIETLQQAGEDSQAAAVKTVLDYAKDLFQSTARHSVLGVEEAAEPLAMYMDYRLHLRVRDLSPNPKDDVLEGWEKFMSGEWAPERPQQSAVTKTTMTVRVLPSRMAEVNAAAEEFGRERDWSMLRGFKLTANSLAVQWLAKKYPAPAGEQDGEQAAQADE